MLSPVTCVRHLHSHTEIWDRYDILHCLCDAWGLGPPFKLKGGKPYTLALQESARLHPPANQSALSKPL